MSHPDAAWSTSYRAPAGVDGEPCRHIRDHVRVGPTSRSRSWMLLVESCGWCGRILRAHEPLTWPQFWWVRRWNAKK